MKFLFYLFLGLLLIINLSCSSTRLAKKKESIVNNSGFILHADSMLKSMEQEFKVYDLQPNEVIADIGFATGWLEGVLMINYDSLTIYAQEINGYSLRTLNVVSDKYSELRTTPNTNELVLVKGRKKKTNLPRYVFDKIIIRQTFHHFSHPDAMLADIWETMKPGAELFIYEPIAAKTYYDKKVGCLNYSRSDLLKIFENSNFQLTREYGFMGTPGNVPPWLKVPPEALRPVKLYVFKKSAIPESRGANSRPGMDGASE
ncbi:MAG: methyltransferase domain-containing protein [Bacteroidia bacterium]